MALIIKICKVLEANSEEPKELKDDFIAQIK